VPPHREEKRSAGSAAAIVTAASIEPELAHLVTRLQQSYPELAEGEIRDIVAATVRDLDGARLRQFVPLLVESSAKAACRERCRRRRRSQRPHPSVPPSASDGRQPGPMFVPVR
jgi:hypothetical protein